MNDCDISIDQNNQDCHFSHNHAALALTWSQWQPRTAVP